MANIVTDSIMEWIAEQSPKRLREMAEKGEDASERLLSQYRGMLRGAHMIVGKHGMQRIRNMKDRDFQRLIDDALRMYPLQGEVLFLHEEWFVKQVRLARDRFLAG